MVGRSQCTWREPTHTRGRNTQTLHRLWDRRAALSTIHDYWIIECCEGILKYLSSEKHQQQHAAKPHESIRMQKPRNFTASPPLMELPAQQSEAVVSDFFKFKQCSTLDFFPQFLKNKGFASSNECSCIAFGFKGKSSDPPPGLWNMHIAHLVFIC